MNTSAEFIQIIANKSARTTDSITGVVMTNPTSHQEHVVPDGRKHHRAGTKLHRTRVSPSLEMWKLVMCKEGGLSP